jgi:four helix bundle protein
LDNIERNKVYLNLDKLEVYLLARQLSKISWVVYQEFDWRLKKIIGDQFIQSVDSVGANIAEGYGRFHYLDKIKFYYNARASLKESRHWLELMIERELVQKEQERMYIEIYAKLSPKLNAFINTTYKNKTTKKS